MAESLEITFDLAGRTPLERRLVVLVRPYVEGLGFELVRVRLSGGERQVVQVMAERPDRTMNVDDCAEISRALSDLFDEEEPLSGEYVLEVSSPGIARPLTRARDFDDFAGLVIKAELTEMMNGRKRFRGILDGVEDGHVMIAEEGDKNEDGEAMVWGLPLEEISEARLVMSDDLVEELVEDPGADKAMEKSQRKDTLKPGKTRSGKGKKRK